MSRAVYSAHLVEDVILVVDEYDEHSPTMSVTNDAEAVVSEVVARFGDHRIAYSDTEKCWDELQHKNGVFTRFASLDSDLRGVVARYDL